MERVEKGEKYYVLLMDKFGIYPLGHRDYRQQSDELLFEAGNYFHTKEEAEAMASKLRAVLAGAEVIEMPSEEKLEAKPIDEFYVRPSVEQYETPRR